VERKPTLWRTKTIRLGVEGTLGGTNVTRRRRSLQRWSGDTDRLDAGGKEGERVDRKALCGRTKRIRPVARDRGKGGHAVRSSRAAIRKTGEKAGTFCGLGARR
jgi:hypothetical protein